MITEQMIMEFKQKYGKIFETELDSGDSFIWHPISREDFRKIMSLTENEKNELSKEDIVYTRQEATCNACILYPQGEELKKILSINAGAAGTICDEIFANSGFSVRKDTKAL